MKIVHTNMLRGWGGQSNRILVEARGAQAAGHEVAFAIPDGSVLGQKASALGMEVWPGYHCRSMGHAVWFAQDVRRLLRDLRQYQPDLIHVHGSPDTWLVSVARGFLGRGAFPPVVRTKHNIFPWRAHPLNRWLLSRLDAFISISSHIDHQIEAFPGIGSKPRALIVSVPDTPRITSPGRPVLRTELASRLRAPDAFLWGSTGRLRGEKGFDVLIEAFARVRASRPNAVLAIAGDGSERAALENAARQRGLGPDVLVFLGFRNDVPDILASLDGYVLSSRSEGLGTAILEALVAGVPVVATRVGGIPDSVHHEQTGLLAESENPESIAEAMIRLMDDPALRMRLSSNAQRLMRSEFTEVRLVQKTLEFYALVAKRGL